MKFEDKIEDTHKVSGTYTFPVDGTYIVKDKEGERKVTVKKGEVVKVEEVEYIARVK